MYNTVTMKGGKECENRVMIYVHDYDQSQNNLRSHNMHTHVLHMIIHCMCETIYDGRKVPVHIMCPTNYDRTDSHHMYNINVG